MRRRRKSPSALDWIIGVGFLLLLWILIGIGLPPWLIVLLILVGPVVAVFAWVFLRQKSLENRYRLLTLANVDTMTGMDFEHYVSRLLQHRGFQVTLTKASGDLGVDLIACNGSLKYAIQVKRHSQLVSRRAVSDAVAGESHYGCNAAMVVTNWFFSRWAVELARSTGCELVDRDALARWINEFHIDKGILS
jgi:restriction system protein